MLEYRSPLHLNNIDSPKIRELLINDVYATAINIRRKNILADCMADGLVDWFNEYNYISSGNIFGNIRYWIRRLCMSTNQYKRIINELLNETDNTIIEQMWINFLISAKRGSFNDTERFNPEKMNKFLEILRRNDYYLEDEILREIDNE